MVESSGSGQTGSRFEEMGKRLDEQVGSALPRMEEEVRKIISFLNDQVVPNLRQDSAHALRTAAEQLSKLAVRLDGDRRPPE